MGICPSKYHKPYRYFPELIDFKKTFECLLVTEREVGELYKRFRRIDVDDSKNIDIAEVLVHLHVEKTFFNKRVFGLLDADASGELNFEEFMVGLWNYCSVEDEFFEHFAFDIYDTDHSGVIDVEEAQYMVKDIYGEEFEHNVYAKRAFHKLEELGTSKINFGAFLEFSRKHKAMLYPAFALQLNLKKYIMGKAFWHRQAINRLKICHGQYLPVTDIIERENFHRNRKLHKRNSDLGNKFRKGSIQKHSNQDSFSAPGTAFKAGSRSFEEMKRRGSHDHGGRRGSKSSKYDHEVRRGSHDSYHGVRRGSKIGPLGDPLHGNEKAGARRGSKLGVDISSDSPEKAGARRGSKLGVDISSDSPEKAGARRGSEIINDVPNLEKTEVHHHNGDEHHGHGRRPSTRDSHHHHDNDHQHHGHGRRPSTKDGHHHHKDEHQHQGHGRRPSTRDSHHHHKDEHHHHKDEHHHHGHGRRPSTRDSHHHHKDEHHHHHDR